MIVKGNIGEDDHVLEHSEQCVDKICFDGLGLSSTLKKIKQKSRSLAVRIVMIVAVHAQCNGRQMCVEDLFQVSDIDRYGRVDGQTRHHVQHRGN